MEIFERRPPESYRRRGGESPLWQAIRLLSWAGFFLVAFVILAPLGYLIIQAFTTREPPPPDIVTEMRTPHHLGVNPADGLLYAATTRGLFKVLDEQRAARIAGSWQENAGFIVIGPDEFLASGKPDLRDLIGDFQPEQMGLLHSSDAGHTWRSVSLKGKASFSTLVKSHGLIYGFERSTSSFMVSEDDGRNWETRSQTAALLDFAVSPRDENEIVAYGENVALRSRDGGVSWQQTTGPQLRFIEWLPTGQLWGADEAGSVYLSSDGAAWSVRGALPGAPEAFLAEDAELFAAIAFDGIYRSTDGGATWQRFYLDPPPRILS